MAIGVGTVVMRLHRVTEGDHEADVFREECDNDGLERGTDIKYGELRKNYINIALKVKPDKKPCDHEKISKFEFQNLQHAYQIATKYVDT